MITFLIFFVVLAALVFVHEVGHFLVAKASGIRVDEFGLGFPPRLFAKKKGETVYSLNAIPFGGFVKIFGEDGAHGAAAHDPRSFARKHRGLQALTVVAGVLFNFLFAWKLFTIGFMIGLPTPAEPGTPPEETSTIVSEVLPGSPAETAGIRRGDRIVFVAGIKEARQDYPTPDDVHGLVASEKKGTIAVGVRSPRESDTRVFVIEPSDEIVPGRRALGIGMMSVVDTKLPFGEALKQGAIVTAETTIGTIRGLFEFVRNFLLSIPQETAITGPVGLVGVVGETRSLGLAYLVSLVALLSVNLGVINLVPFPALDGGRLLIIALEGIMRRELNPKIVGYINGAGLAALLFLMLIVTIKDIRAL